MKKNYIAPSTQAVKINVEQLICDSLRVFDSTDTVDEKAGKVRGSRTEEDNFDDLW